MAKPEIKWLNEHNTAVQNAVLPLLDEDQDGAAKDWLIKATKRQSCIFTTTTNNTAEKREKLQNTDICLLNNSLFENKVKKYLN
jgi:hypothetical protein